MSRPGPAATANGRVDARPVPSRVPRGRAPGAVVRVESEVVGRGTAVDAAPTPAAPERRSPAGGPTHAPVPFRPVVAVPAGDAPTTVAPAVPGAPGVPDPALLPAHVPGPIRRPGLVERVTLLLRRLGGGQGRHRSGRTSDGWSMFAPHPADRRRGTGWTRR